jgi:hypothetical protein
MTDYLHAADLPAGSLLRDVCLWSPRLAREYANVPPSTVRELTKDERRRYDHEQYLLRREREARREVH